MNPGSPAWGAGVLDQARRPPLSIELFFEVFNFFAINYFAVEMIINFFYSSFLDEFYGISIK